MISFEGLDGRDTGYQRNLIGMRGSGAWKTDAN